MCKYIYMCVCMCMFPFNLFENSIPMKAFMCQNLMKWKRSYHLFLWEKCLDIQSPKITLQEISAMTDSAAMITEKYDFDFEWVCKFRTLLQNFFRCFCFCFFKGANKEPWNRKMHKAYNHISGHIWWTLTFTIEARRHRMLFLGSENSFFKGSY